MEINGLAFKPKTIIITMEAAVGLTSGSGAYPQSAIYTERPIRTSGTYTGLSTVTMTNGDRFYVDGEYAFVSATGFRLPIYVTHTNYNLTWYAFDI